MSFIEGVGDEVAIFLLIIIVFVLAALVTFIGNVPSFNNARINLLSSEQESNTIRQSSENSTTVIHRRRLPSRQSFNEYINEATEDTNHNQIVTEEQNSDELHRTDERSSADSRAVESSNEELVPSAEQTNNEVDRTSENTIQTDGNIIVEQNQSESSSLDEQPVENRSAGEIRVRLKYLDDTERLVTTAPDAKICDFKKKHFSEDVRNNKVIRLIFAGRLLQNNLTVNHYRILDNSVVHVQVLPAPTIQSSPAASQESDLDLGRMLWPVLTVILGLCWVTYFKYPEFYNNLCLGMLLLFSGCFFYFISQTHH